jgi:catechol 2,3-dioxygenase-like lactoylglutathione lyase family enzyme
MVTFAGVDHVSFTVSDMDRSQQFYTSVLDFVPVLDVGYGRILMHPATGFTLSRLITTVRMVVPSPSSRPVSTTSASPRRPAPSWRTGSVASTRWV